MTAPDEMRIRLTNRLFSTHPIVAHCPGALPDRCDAPMTTKSRATIGAPFHPISPDSGSMYWSLFSLRSTIPF